MLQSALKIDMTPVPYKGTGPAMTDLMGGQVDLMCEQATNSVPQIEATRSRSMASPACSDASSRRSRVPTLAESGLTDFNFAVWHGLYAPHGTPPAVLAKLNAALRNALKDPELIKRQEALGITVVTDARLDPADTKSSSRAKSVAGRRRSRTQAFSLSELMPGVVRDVNMKAAPLVAAA